MKNLLCTAGLALLVAGCATNPADRRVVLEATLTGLQEVPGPGDADGTGTAEIRVEAAAARLCWNLYARQIEPAIAAHIHRGAAGTAGPPVVTLATPDANGRSEGCTAVDAAVAREIATQPHLFYVNVHDPAHRAGAIRGQLRGSVIRPRAAR